MEKDKNLERHIDNYIEYLKQKKEEEVFIGKLDETKEKERIKIEHRNNQRRFEYDYEEDFYEPIYEDDYEH